MAVIAPLVGAALGGAAATAINSAWVAGTIGYAIGAGLGSLAGSMLFPPKMPGQNGPRAADGLIQISTYGAGIPIVYGTMAMAGNVIWSAGLREVRVRQKVGSGKAKTKITIYNYYCDFAVGLCEGEINCIRRVWLDSDLKYDASSTDPDVIAANATFLAGCTLHAGGESQLADALIEAHVGVGNAPAYRGLAYLVFDDLFLEPYGNRIPNVRVELVKADLYYTSEPYPIMASDDLAASAAWIKGGSWVPPSDSMDASCTVAGGSMAVTASYGTYGNFGAVAWDGIFDRNNSREAEWLECSANLSHGALYASATFSTYGNWPAESLDASCALVSGSMAVTAGYVDYSNWPAESLDSSCTLVSGSLT